MHIKNFRELFSKKWETGHRHQFSCNVCSPEECVDVSDEPHDDDPEERTQLDNVPDEDRDAIERVRQREDLALRRHGDDVAVAWSEGVFHENY